MFAALDRGDFCADSVQPASWTTSSRGSETTRCILLQAADENVLVTAVDRVSIRESRAGRIGLAKYGALVPAEHCFFCFLGYLGAHICTVTLHGIYTSAVCGHLRDLVMGAEIDSFELLNSCVSTKLNRVCLLLT
jgi:hypothetical protein